MSGEQRRLCACGCGREARALDHHRQRAYRSKVKRTASDQGVPTYATLSNVSTGTHPRIGDTRQPARKPTRRSPDLRISYRKAVETVGTELATRLRITPVVAQKFATDVLRPLLSEKQRASLDQSSNQRGALTHG